MSGITPEKVERLRALFSTLPASVPARLVTVAEQADPELGAVLRACLADADEPARALFFEPLIPVSDPDPAAPPSRRYWRAETLQALWAWLDDEQDPVATAAARKLAARPDAAEISIQLDEHRLRVAEALRALVAEAREDARARKSLMRRFPGEPLERLEAAGDVLSMAGVLRDAFYGLPECMDDLGEAVCADIRDRYDAATAACPAAGAWVLFLLSARLIKPWKILRLFEVIAGRSDDLLVSKTDMAAIGDVLLEDADHHLKGFARPPRTLEEADAAVDAMTRFAALTVGMTREIGIRKDGSWGRKLFELRQKAAEQMDYIHRRCTQVFDVMAPDPKKSAQRFARRDVGEQEYEEAAALARFMYGVKDDAGRAAAGGAHADMLSNLRERLDAFGRGLVDQLRSSDEAQRQATQRRLEHTTDLLRAFGDPDTADVLLRRGAAAQAA